MLLEKETLKGVVYGDKYRVGLLEETDPPWSQGQMCDSLKKKHF